MTSTYEMIRALPGKTTNWCDLLKALRAHYLKVYAQKHNGAEPWAGTSLDVWDSGLMAFSFSCSGYSSMFLSK